MTRTTSNSFRHLAVAVVSLGMAWSAHGSLIEIKFQTNTFTTQADFALVLANAGITPGGMQGNFYYESTTVGGAPNSATQETYNGAVKSLAINAPGWFSQSLTGIGANGDIRIQNNSTGGLDRDEILVTVTCAPVPNNTTSPGTCTSASSNFNYSFTSGGVLWALDQFQLLLQESGAAEVLSDLSLPSEQEWESTSWAIRRVTLRFNPFGAGIGNENATAVINILEVPEPGSLALLGLGLLGLAGMRRKA